MAREMKILVTGGDKPITDTRELNLAVAEALGQVVDSEPGENPNVYYDYRGRGMYTYSPEAAAADEYPFEPFSPSTDLDQARESAEKWCLLNCCDFWLRFSYNERKYEVVVEQQIHAENRWVCSTLNPVMLAETICEAILTAAAATVKETAE